METAAVIPLASDSFSLAQLANFAIALAIIAAAALAVIYIFVGGISFILSGGQEEKIKQAVHTIRYAIIGLIVAIAAVVLVSIIGNLLGFNFLSYVSWGEIRDMMQTILTRLTQSATLSP